MKLHILLAIASVLIVSCAGPKLMRCPEEAPPDIFHCEKHVYRDFRMCKPAVNDFKCVDVKTE